MGATDETNIRTSVEAAKAFVDWYYPALNDGRPLASAYVNNNTTYQAAGHPPADICINGRVLSTPEEWDKILKEQRTTTSVPPTTTTTTTTTPATTTKTTTPAPPPPTTRSTPLATKKIVRHDVQGYDVHVINNDYKFGAAERIVELHGRHDGVRMMLMVTVSGTVTLTTADKHGKVGTSDDPRAIKQRFNDVFVLVPNWDEVERRGARQHAKRFLIASQAYRAY